MTQLGDADAPDRQHDESLVPAAEFTVREFARTAAGSHRDSLDLAAYEREPLDAVTLELVDFLARLERSTMAQLRSVLVTPTHKDARITAFLVTWAYEKYWIADALEAVLSAHPDYVPAESHGPGRLTALRRSLADRFEPIRESVVANLIGEDVVAVHTTTGVVDEWTTRAAFEALRDGSANTEFRAMLERLLGVKERHGAFFAAQTRDRLRRSPKAAKLTRKRLARQHWPLGAIDEDPQLAARFFDALLPEATVAAIDARVEAYPGLAGLGLLRRAKSGQPAITRAAEALGRTAADVRNRIR